MGAVYEIFDPLLPREQADAMLALCERYGRYGSYAEDKTNAVEFAPELAQRHDAAAHFVRSGGRFGRREDPRMLAVRTNYFRETYCYGSPEIEGIEPFLHHEGFAQAARKIHDRPVVVPHIVYANLLLPGQELAVHTDVPEFRGAHRKRFPQWLMVVMHHSGLFERWRMPIVTGIAYFESCEGGALAYYPYGAEGPAETLPVRHNTAIALDTDSVFHGVDRVAETRPLPALRPGMKLRFEGEGRWAVGWPDQAPLAHYRWGEIRFSVSWKAYCYADEAERRRAEEHTDDLELDFILDTLVRDLERRGRLECRPEDSNELGRTLIDAYVRFPAPEPAAG